MSEQENKVIVRRWFDVVLNGRDLDVADEILDGSLSSSFGGREDLKQVIAYLHAAFPDFHEAIDELIAEGNRLAVRSTIRCTHTGGEYAGLPATGKQLEVAAVNLFTVVNGKIVEQWGVFDQLGVRKQLGFTVLPPQIS